MADAGWNSACAAGRRKPIALSHICARASRRLDSGTKMRRSMPHARSASTTSRRARGVAWALARAVPVFLGARVLAIVFVPLALAALGFLAIGVLAWAPFTAWLASL